MSLCNEIIRSMKKYLSEGDQKPVIGFDNEQFMLSEKEIPVYRQYMQELKEIAEIRKDEIDNDVFSQLLDTDDECWGQKLFESTKETISLPRHSFVWFISPEKLADCILRSNNEEIYNFRLALSNLYESNNYEMKSDDFSNLQKLSELVGNMDTSSFGEIKKISFAYLQHDLNKYLKRIKNATEEKETRFQPEE